VHYQTHQKQLEGVLGSDRNIFVIDYPCPAPKITKPKELRGKKLLIYGQIREDKGIYEFLVDERIQRLKITIAGRIVDRRVLTICNSNYTFINEFLSLEQIHELFAQHDFLLLPYSPTYTGGAGPLKDGFAYATPVICPNWDLFREVVEVYGTGLLYNSPAEIETLLSTINHETYRKLSLNCIKYARENNWETMRSKYFRMYDYWAR
jgi:glycosyltransferase involved in cell wall biosynthesis